MRIERFGELAEAFGSDLDRWPAIDRAEALALTIAEPETTRRLLAEARLLDGLLDASAGLQPSPALQARIIDSAPRAKGAARRRWAGVGLSASLAAAGLVGIMAGAVAGPLAVTHVREQAAADPAEEAARLLGEPREVFES